MTGAFGHRQVVNPAAPVGDVLWQDEFLWIQTGGVPIQGGTPDGGSGTYGAPVGDQVQSAYGSAGLDAIYPDQIGDWSGNQLLPGSGDEWGFGYHGCEITFTCRSNASTTNSAFRTRAKTGIRNTGIRVQATSASGGAGVSVTLVIWNTGFNELYNSGEVYLLNTPIKTRLETEVVNSTTIRIALKINDVEVYGPQDITVPSEMTTDETTLVDLRRTGAVTTPLINVIQIDTFREML